MDQKKRQKKISLRQEKIANEELGSRMMPASGALPHGGGDGRLAGQIRLECKFTEVDKYILKLSDLVKLRTQAIKGGLEEPIFQIEFRGKHTGKYAVVPALPGKFDESEQTTVVQQVKQYTLFPEILERAHAAGLEPLIRITFINPPIVNMHSITYAIYEWNTFLRSRQLRNDPQLIPSS